MRGEPECAAARAAIAGLLQQVWCTPRGGALFSLGAFINIHPRYLRHFETTHTEALGALSAAMRVKGAVKAGAEQAIFDNLTANLFS